MAENSIEYKYAYQHVCPHCDPDSDICDIFYEPLTKEWYYLYRTNEYDKVDNSWIYDKIYIKYCPWCGRELEN